MIAFLRGDFVLKTPALVHVEAGGVGYELQISLNTYSSIQDLDKGVLLTYLHIREDAHILYGFFDRAEKELFILLISVSGVGASTARMMLSSMRPEEITRAILQGNARQLESIKGIGKKSAERIILELRDKIGKSKVETNISSLIDNSLEQDALNALIALGIARPAAENAIRKVMNEGSQTYKVEDIIKKALKTL
ncbi:Holliday junction branch migration protein RuvA [Flavitalea sp. BT771]|uniref:Holliday junction branch migration protein RuvA n=1 Tax=Flavitalea sp. BT771 TaxID=3063329 RepID=UPI0026E3CB58|nr:Holliday junction branch migration protein RuvA [Flavitalea sp. BT771]MDO6429709.1 Holliday junction branch migration protein RuvA [Flavitalea sp. BT771]MDV6218163.1 Holliday junction branch migration protein RuvA [Flavitalea sp. BT771]